jgi:RNA recognition motif. (a.k.a. RRM, RBD, or RNP domain)
VHLLTYSSSDADSDVLADYVLALLRADDSDDEVRQNCEDNLRDFLRDGSLHSCHISFYLTEDAGSEKFVQEAFTAVQTKSYLPNYVPPPNHTSNFQLSNALGAAPFFPSLPPVLNPPTGPTTVLNGHGLAGQNNINVVPELAQQRNRKRAYDEHDDPGLYDVQRGLNGGPRSFKQPRLNYRSGRGRNDHPSPVFGQSDMNYQPQIPTLNPQLPSALPQFDPNNPLSALLAMQALFPLMGLPALPLPGTQMTQATRGRGKRCRDYDLKGFCAKGSTCQYEHGSDSIVVPTGIAGDKPSPLNQMLPFQSMLMPPFNGTHSHPSNGLSNHRRNRRTNGRASFSAKGKNYDRSITTIVVENIPDDFCTEEHVREYFSQFGNILEIMMQPRVALVKYDIYEAARQAYSSPKTIFENRFVKVYWYKPDQVEKIKSMSEDVVELIPHVKMEPEFDPVDFEKKVAEAQKAHEEKVKKQLEAKIQKEEIGKKMQEQAAERRRLLQAIVEKERRRNGGISETETTLKEAEESEKLKAKLAILEAEAQSLGIDPNDAYNAMDTSHGTNGYRGRGRGGYRSRGGYFPRGRGAFRGWGHSPRGAYTGGSVMRLDNRPKKVAVMGVAAGTPEDEELRQHLFVSCQIGLLLKPALTIVQHRFEQDSVEINPHPEKSDSQVISFKERYMAESVRI